MASTPSQQNDRSERGVSVAPGVVNEILRVGVVVTDSDGRVIDVNETASQILTAAHGDWPVNATCCSLFGCHRREPLASRCITALAADSQDPLPELRIDLPPKRPSVAVWISAARLTKDGSKIVMQLRPATVGDRRRRTHPQWMARPALRIRALGRTRIETETVAIEGDWLLQRPGHLLKYLICQRRRPVHADEIVEALWPDAGVAGRNTLRHYIHVLRERLEPNRSPRAPSSFITSAGSTYVLNPLIALDVDEFENLASAALQGLVESGTGGVSTVDCMEQAMQLYEGDLIAEEPFAEWAFSEREAMRSLAHQMLSHLIDHYLQSGDLTAATAKLERTTELRPLDADIQRQLIGVYLRQGRHSDASRRFGALKHRMLAEFGQEPDFSLAELARDNGQTEAKR